MNKQYLMVTSRSLPGREDEYRQWYLEYHMSEVLAVPGFLSGQLHLCKDPTGKPTGQFRSIFEVAPIEPQALMSALMSRGKEMKMTDAIDPTSVEFIFLTPA